MEDLIKNDATFEVFANSEGAELLNNRVLLSYPSEKSSFDVFLGADGYSNFEPTEEEKAQAKKDALEAAGVKVGQTPSETAQLLRAILQG